MFDGAHARLIQVLGIGAAISVPSVIGNVNKHLRALIRELTHFVGEHRLIANEHAERTVARVQRRSRRAAANSPLGVFICYESVLDRKSTRLNSSHQIISYAVFCLKK